MFFMEKESVELMWSLCVLVECAVCVCLRWGSIFLSFLKLLGEEIFGIKILEGI